MARNINWEWNPNDKQKELFEEWKKNTINFLVCSREGCHVRSISESLMECTGDDMPLIKMGFHTINQFLYAMQECIEVRTLNGNCFIFIRESAVPESMMHIRELVMEQGNDKSCKTRTGAIRKPSKNQSKYVPVEELLRASRHNIRPPQSTYVTMRPVVVPVYNPQTRRPGTPSNGRSRPTGNSRALFHQRRTDNVSWRPRSNNTAKSGTQSGLGQQRQLDQSNPSLANTAKSSFKKLSKPLINSTTQFTEPEIAKPTEYSNGKENIPGIWTHGATENSANQIVVAPLKTSFVTSSSPAKNLGSVSANTLPIILESVLPKISSKQVAPKPLAEEATFALEKIASKPTRLQTGDKINGKENSQTIPKNANDNTPIVGFTLDTCDVLAQVINLPSRYAPTDRNIMGFPDIKFLPSFRGGSCNVSLKEYLTMTSDVTRYDMSNENATKNTCINHKIIKKKHCT